jgi:hypothetical protein
MCKLIHYWIYETTHMGSANLIVDLQKKCIQKWHQTHIIIQYVMMQPVKEASQHIFTKEDHQNYGVSPY